MVAVQAMERRITQQVRFSSSRCPFENHQSRTGYGSGMLDSLVRLLKLGRH